MINDIAALVLMAFVVVMFSMLLLLIAE